MSENLETQSANLLLASQGAIQDVVELLNIGSIPQIFETYGSEIVSEVQKNRSISPIQFLGYLGLGENITTGSDLSFKVRDYCIKPIDNDFRPYMLALYSGLTDFIRISSFENKADKTIEQKDFLCYMRNLIFEIIYSSPKILPSELIFELEIAFEEINGRKPNQKEKLEIVSFVRAAKHEYIFSQILESSGIEYNKSSVGEDRAGVDFVLTDLPIGIDVKCSPPVDDKGITKKIVLTNKAFFGLKKMVAWSGVSDNMHSPFTGTNDTFRPDMSAMSSYAKEVGEYIDGIVII